MIELRHVEKAFEMATPLKDINAVINEGDVISVIGPSGTGKSTLLRCINMLDAPTKGEILVDGVFITDPACDLAEVRKKLGMVFQSFNLFGHLTIIENIMIPQIDLLGRSRQEAYDKGMELLAKVGMASRYLQYPEQLSGGQKQRVAIARTLAMDPEIILFDEPTSALDPTMVGEVEAVIRDLAKSGITMMIVTHDMKFAREICNRVFYLDQGGIYEDGSPTQIFEHPLKDRTRRFIRHLKVLEMTMTRQEFDFPDCCSKIDVYCKSNNASSRIALRSRLVFEELTSQLINDPASECDKISLVYEYDAENDAMSLQVLYDGRSFSPADGEDELSVMILMNSVSEIQHTDIQIDIYTNELKIKLKK